MQRNGIAWLASSSADILRARGVLDALRQPGVLDELGFLTLNAAFAQRLYPGVTTIMTRARYLFFVPAMYRYLEASGLGRAKDVDSISRDLQYDLRNALAKNETSFIGRDGGRHLVRVPSSIYWNALDQLGVMTRQVSESTYQRELSRGQFSRNTFKDDDKVVHEADGDSLWTSELSLAHVMVGGGFPPATDFRLRKKEAAFLRQRYSTLEPDGLPNMLTLMIEQGVTLRNSGALQAFNYPWDVPVASPILSGILEHARRLSLMARGATLQYYRMLLSIKKGDDSGVERAIAKWWREAIDDLRSWDLEEFFRLVTMWRASRGPRERAFVEGWVSMVSQAGSAEEALRNSKGEALIRAREDHVRPGKQRLRPTPQQRSWELPQGFASSPYYMDYRHRVGRQIARDIVDGVVGGGL